MRFAHGVRDTGGSNLIAHKARFELVKGSPYRLGVVLVSRRRGAGRQAKLRESRRHNPSVKETA